MQIEEQLNYYSKVSSVSSLITYSMSNKTCDTETHMPRTVSSSIILHVQCTCTTPTRLTAMTRPDHSLKNLSGHNDQPLLSWSGVCWRALQRFQITMFGNYCFRKSPLDTIKSKTWTIVTKGARGLAAVQVQLGLEWSSSIHRWEITLDQKTRGKKRYQEWPVVRHLRRYTRQNQSVLT